MKSTSYTSPHAVMMAARNLLSVAALLLSACTSTTNSDVVVSVKDQKMGLYSEGLLVKKYKISTSKFGLGDSPGSNHTPLGKHVELHLIEVVNKYGAQDCLARVVGFWLTNQMLLHVRGLLHWHHWQRSKPRCDCRLTGS